MLYLEKSTLEHASVQLDGGTFKECTFIDCEMIYEGGEMPTFISNRFKDCRWKFSGAAGNTLGFLSLLYADGATEIVEATFESIRNAMKGAKDATGESK